MLAKTLGQARQPLQASLQSEKDFYYNFSALELMICLVLGDWYEQLYPLVITLKDCMGEVVTRAKQSMAFVLLQELACGLPQCLMLTLRRDIVFSQAVGCLMSLISYCSGYFDDAAIIECTVRVLFFCPVHHNFFMYFPLHPPKYFIM